PFSFRYAKPSAPPYEATVQVSSGFPTAAKRTPAAPGSLCAWSSPSGRLRPSSVTVSGASRQRESQPTQPEARRRPAVFRRPKPGETAGSAVPARAERTPPDGSAAGGRGRPAPSRKEAEAAARARAKAAKDPKSSRRLDRQVRMERSR